MKKSLKEQIKLLIISGIILCTGIFGTFWVNSKDFDWIFVASPIILSFVIVMVLLWSQSKKIAHLKWAEEWEENKQNKK